MTHRLKEANTSNVDCSFLGVFLAVCGIGLYFLPEDRGGSFPSGDEKFTLVSKWLDAAASALTLDRFLDCESRMLPFCRVRVVSEGVGLMASLLTCPLNSH